MTITLQGLSQPARCCAYRYIRFLHVSLGLTTLALFMLLTCSQASAAGPGSLGCQSANSNAHDSTGQEGLVISPWFIGEQVTAKAEPAQGGSDGVTGLRLTVNGVVVDTQPFPGTVSSKAAIKNFASGTVRWEAVGEGPTGRSVKWTVICTPDQTDPTCELAGVGFRQITVRVQDDNGGIRGPQSGGIVATKLSPNAHMVPVVWKQGTTYPVLVTFRRDAGEKATVQVTVTNQNGGQVVCDPVLVTVGTGTETRRTTVRRVPHAEHFVRVSNGEPGLKRLRVVVNGTNFRIKRLRDGESRSLDIGSAMRAGHRNTITLVGVGGRNATAEVLISDM